ncbi:MAG: ATP-binding protein [Candidatus Omnitrophota bacterium]
MQFFKNYKITTKFVLWFLFIALLTLTASIYISYKFSLQALKKEIANSLFAVRDNKANQIEAHSLKLKKDVSALFYTQEFIDAADRFFRVFSNSGADSPDYQAIREEFRPMFAYYRHLFDYDNIMLINLDGEVVLSLLEDRRSRALYNEALFGRSELFDVFTRAKDSEEIAISSFEHHPQTGGGAIFIAHPIFKGADFIGIAVAQVSNRIFYGFAQDCAGLGQTGELIIASKIKDEAVFIAPTRFDPQAAFARTIRLDSGQGLYVQRSLNGEDGSGTFVDYRGREVLAAWRYLPTLKLGMVVKMDISEIFAPANRLRNTLFNVSSVILILVVVIAILIARSISRPIKALTRISKTISGGDLLARAKIEATDEIGELAHSFNQMTNSLVQANVKLEQKKAEVEEQKRLLEIVNKELDNFAYTVSHDLRAPLRGIDGLGVLLEEECAARLDEQGREYLRNIRASANRMKMLIDDLLKLSRISRVKNPYEDVSIEELIKSVADRLEFDIQKCNVDVAISAGLPVARCDRIKMEEVFFNLISNAIKFSSKNNKETRPRVEIGYSDKYDRHEFYVKDNGIGIDKKYHNEIFGIFRRLHAVSEYEGTGAGLTIVKRIVEDHDGSIWIDSEEGRGAAFYFTLPKRMKEKRKIGEILVEEGAVSEADVKNALEKQGKYEAEDYTQAEGRG